MAEQVNRLVDEVERIVTAPYVPSLQDLHDLVQNTGCSAIKYWSLQKPCQVGLLADVLVEALSRSRVALPLVTAFASSSAFREAVLSRHPVVLDAFLEKAIEAEEPEYHPACISLLSSPFPSSVAPSARLSGFITKLVSTTAANPCADTISPLHSLITGLQGSPRVFDEIPSGIMSSLQSEFTKILRNFDSHMGNLLCLATFARIASTPYHDHSNKHGPNTPSWLLNIQNFFGSKRGLKTLDLVALHVILACSSTSNHLTPSQAAESIRLSISIADAVDPQQKQTWISSNSPKIAKLCEKVARDGLDPEIQMMGVAFLLFLRPAAELPSHIRELGMHVLVSKGPRGALGLMPHELISRMASSLANSEDSAIYHLLRFTFETLKDGVLPDGECLLDLHLAQLLLSGFQSAQSESMSRALLKSRSTKEAIVALLGRFPMKPPQAECNGSEICHCARGALTNKVLISIFDLYFAAILSQDGDAADFMMMKSFVDRAAESLTQVNCSLVEASLKNFRVPLSLRSRQEFLSASPPARDWRSGVTNLFTQNAHLSYDSMMKKIEDTCFDLERRCYDVEGPLRVAEEERDRRIAEAEQLSCRNGELERKLEHSSQTVSDLQQELARLEEQADNASARIDELSGSLEASRQELHGQRCQAEEAIQNERERARSRELDFMASSTEKDDRLEELQEGLRSLQAENELMRQSLGSASEDRTGLLERFASLQQELAETQNLLETNKHLCAENEDEVQRLLADNEDMRLELGNMRTTVDEQNLEVERLYSNLQESEEKLRSEIDALKQEHEAHMTQAASEAEGQREENGRLHEAMQLAAHNASKENQLKDKRIHQLEKKIQSLRDERAAKAREFFEAQQHTGRLMNVMGFVAKPAESPVANKHQGSSTADQIQPTDTHRSVAFDDDDSELVESFESMTSNFRGPSPKRPRGNRRSMISSQIPSLKTPSKPDDLAKRGSPTKPGSPISRSARRPLGETDGNSPIKSQSTNRLKNSQHVGRPSDENHLQPFDLDMDLEFSKDFIFTSTAFSGSTDQIAPK